MKRIDSVEATRNEGEREGHGSKGVQHTVVHCEKIQVSREMQVKLAPTEEVRLTQTTTGRDKLVDCRLREKKREERKKAETVAADID